ncbi:MAG TPA: HPr family phosphocarrier protein [Candidatus Limnocylindrales bacterium]|nr:HPr family phosphocarrier protein [Candidatus Limnocylindrales bacterium]
MTSREAVLRDRYGLHPRAAHRIQSEAAGFQARIRLEPVDGQAAVDAGSMLGLVSSGIRTGDRVKVIADGTDEEEAVAAVAALLDGGVCHP